MCTRSWELDTFLRPPFLAKMFVSLNCFWRHRMVYTFTAFLGTIGGFHALLTPQLTVGDAFPILLHFYFNHMALIVVPVVMTKALPSTYSQQPRTECS